MIQISQMKLPPDHTREDMEKKIARLLKLPREAVLRFEVVKKSVDARKKPEIFFVYTVWAEVKNEAAVVKKAKNQNVTIANPAVYAFSGAAFENGVIGKVFEKRFPGQDEDKVDKKHEEKNGNGGGNEAGGTGRNPAPELLKKDAGLRLETGKSGSRPVIIGSGPAGLFCGLLLARYGYRPLILERGKAVEERVRDVEAFWQGGSLDPESNVQFGEGGAGTFSDGKLNTLVKDPQGRGRFVLQCFVEAGADPDILYMQKPHIGTDVLRRVVKNLREEILRLGGEIRFQSCVTDFLIAKDTEERAGDANCQITKNQVKCARDTFSRIGNGRLTGVVVNGVEELRTQAVVLAIGHSARDTFETLYQKQVPMEAKAFAVGLRMEHPQSVIEQARYGVHPYGKLLPVADYKVTHRAVNGRGVYSFCMCPGGYVVNASSEPGRLAVNGMSNRSRDGENANSALIVTVTPEDFVKAYPECPVLSGMEFQRHLEARAYQLCQGKIPVQLFQDFEAGRQSTGLGTVAPQMKGRWDFGNLRGILPDEIGSALVEGVYAFDRQVSGFARPDALFSGVESRTSSPVRILRDEQCESSIKGLYPCGEGAGYAGGIMSAAMDGLRVAERIIKGKRR